MNAKTSIRSVIFLGRKPCSVQAVEWLLKQKIAIRAIVTKEGTAEARALRLIARKRKIPFYTDDEPLYRRIEKKDPTMLDVDLVISFLFWKKIREPLYRLPRHGCINFHPAPLPEYKSRAGYNTAILDQKKTFGVSAHYIDSESFDSGPIIKVLRFPMDPTTETAYALEQRTQGQLLKLFEWTIRALKSGRKIPLKKNAGGLYLTSKQLEALKNVDVNKDSAEQVHRKIRAFFFPPYHGAKITIDGEDFTLLDEEMLRWIHSRINPNHV